jgi:hypothetical protein
MNILLDQAPSKSAVFSPDGKYRYHLFRSIPGGSERIALFIMLNPASADHEVDDQTIRKCMGFCRRWGCGELHVVNLFAVRATNPTAIRQVSDPVGPDNRHWIMRAIRLAADPDRCARVICAWGTHGVYMRQDQIVLGWVKRLCTPMALGTTRDDHPRHPLYASYDTGLVSFERCGPIARRPSS